MQLASFQKTTKIVGLVVILIIVLLLIIFVGGGAGSFLSRASSCGVEKVNAAQVTANSAVVSWETADITQGRVEYGTNATNLTFSAPEGSSGKVHNVPLTLLTPNTVYYYLISVGNNKCDSSGQKCDTACVPWSFTTASVTPQSQIVAPISTPSATLAPTSGLGTPSATISIATSAATPTSSLSSFCTQVRLNVGGSSQDASKWASLKIYDVDNNGVINGLDVIKCQKAGK